MSPCVKTFNLPSNVLKIGSDSTTKPFNSDRKQNKSDVEISLFKLCYNI